MDRFIDRVSNQIEVYTRLFKIQYGQIYRANTERLNGILRDLKSNMDRFIAYKLIASANNISDLKSNMDRFIALNT